MHAYASSRSRSGAFYRRINACVYACMHKDTETDRQTDRQTHTHTRTCIDAYIHRCMHAYIHARTHAYIHGNSSVWQRFVTESYRFQSPRVGERSHCLVMYAAGVDSRRIVGARRVRKVKMQRCVRRCTGAVRVSCTQSRLFSRSERR